MGKKKRDLQGSELINGVHKDLKNNPGYRDRFEKAIDYWEKKQGDGKAK